MKTKTLKIAILIGVLSATNLSHSINFNGDFTFQQEYIKVKHVKARHRQRLKAHLTGTHQLNEHGLVTFGLASSMGSPTSNYVTFGNSFSPMGISLDQANAQFFLWKKHLSTTLGKMEDPFTRVGGSQLQWDSDARPEGMALAFVHPEVVANLGGFVLEERPTDEDSLVFGGDVYFPLSLNEKSSLKLGVGVFVYTQVRDKSFLYDTTSSFGNSSGLSGTTYAEDFTIMNPGVELSTRLLTLPFKVYFDFIYNTEASNDNTGWTFGAQVGEAKKWKEFAFNAYFLRKEADATLGSLTDSNFYSQATGTQGFVVSGTLGIFDNANAGLTWYSTDRIKNPRARENRIQLTATAKF